VPQADADIDEESVRKLLTGRVSRVEQPRDIKIVGAIPRNPTGKVVRSQLTP
jgi:acyl-coenzyme A synthetase/AMP-(fatty) acid ligase